MARVVMTDLMRYVVGAGAAILATSTVLAETRTLTSSADATIFEESADRADGAGLGLFVGNTRMLVARRALLRFDVSELPTGFTVQSASLQLWLSATAAGGSSSIAVHRLVHDWSEGPSGSSGGSGAPAQSGDVSWLYRTYADTLWDAPGGDYASVPSTSLLVDSVGGFVTWASTPPLVADIEAWLEDANSNFGWILLGDEERSQTAKRFDSREADMLTRLPTLTLVLAPVPEPSVAALLFGGIALIALRARRALRSIPRW